MVLKSTIVSGMLAGGLALGALVTYDGGSILDRARTTIATQANQLNVFKSQQDQLAGKLTEAKERLAYLEENGTDADQAEIDSLKTKIADYEANVDAGSEQVANRINDLEAQVTAANDDAKALETTMNENETTAAPMLQSELDVMTDNLPEGYKQLKMMNDTPQVVYDMNGTATKLTIDKNVADINTAHLTIINNDQSRPYTITMKDGTKYTAAPASTLDLGLVKSLDAQTLTITDAYNLEVGKYYLMAK